MQMRLIFLFTVSLLLTGCGDRGGVAPVVESRWLAANAYQRVHQVQPGETLYAIAFRYDKDYRQLAAYNHLQRPYTLRVGQKIHVYPTVLKNNGNSYLRVSPVHKTVTVSQPSRPSSFHENVAHKQMGIMTRNVWYWPVRGKVVSYFSPSQAKKGIDIASKKGETVYAAASGVVAYAGSGLSGYGNLIIIKHNNQYLTAYGNNARILVNEGQKIRAGQAIAVVGVIDRRFWGVHFEIRQAGQPVNPLNYLGRAV